MTTTSKEMIALLERSLYPVTGWPKGALCVEVEAPRPRVTRVRRGRTRSFKSGPRRRADAIWCPANTGRLEVFEIKVSRSDLVRELSDLTKAATWTQYANAFYLFISDPAFLDGLLDQIPMSWGILSPPVHAHWRKLNVIRPATELVPVHQELAWSRVMAWTAWKRWQEGQAREPDYGFEPVDDYEEEGEVA